MPGRAEPTGKAASGYLNLSLERDPKEPIGTVFARDI